MSSLTQYNFDGNRIRVVISEAGNPAFPASDLCRVLGMDYQKRGTGPYLKHIDPAEVFTLDTIVPRTPHNDLPPHTTMVSEAGMYQLMLRSRKPEAAKFRKWVTGEVLPSIRKTGSYVHKPAAAPEPVLMVQTRDLTEDALHEVATKLAEANARQLREALREIKDSVSQAMEQYAPRRREVSATVREDHRRFIAARGYRCPCCDQTKSSWVDFNVDHYKDRQDPSLTATWGICAGCNQSLKDAAKHKDAEPAFQAYQGWLKAWRVAQAAVSSSELQVGLFD